jgi:hypothetical protein
MLIYVNKPEKDNCTNNFAYIFQNQLQEFMKL